MHPFAVLIPHRCLACLDIMPQTGLCPACLYASPVDNVVYQVSSMIQMQSVFAYDSPVGVAIRKVKTTGSLPGAAALAALLAPTLAKVPASIRTFIPAPWVRQRRRGLDLPQWLAGPGALRLFTRAIGQRQHTLSGIQRLSNPQRFLSLNPGTPIPKYVVLIDDVRTTGATSIAGANLLTQYGTNVSIVTLAGVGKPSAQLADQFLT